MTTTTRSTPTNRVFRRQRVWELTEPVFAFGASMLACAARERYRHISTVIGIANGGIRLATTIAEALSVDCHHVRARHNTSDAVYQQSTGRVKSDFTALAGQQFTETVLLVDDICGSGATFRAVTAGLTPHLEPDASVVTAALCRNLGACIPPDLWLWDVGDWVIFPWERDRLAEITTVPLPQPSMVRPR
jgi:hypoxanthine phosphoribosyltransferase